MPFCRVALNLWTNSRGSTLTTGFQLGPGMWLSEEGPADRKVQWTEIGGREEAARGRPDHSNYIIQDRSNKRRKANAEGQEAATNETITETIPCGEGTKKIHEKEVQAAKKNMIV